VLARLTLCQKKLCLLRHYLANSHRLLLSLQLAFQRPNTQPEDGVRMARDMRQQKLAELADLNIRNVQRIEAGEIDILLSTTVRIRKALGCALDRLLPKEF